MAKKRGRAVFAPGIVIEEINDIMREDNIFEQSEAFRKLVKYSREGREVGRILNLNWSKKKKW